jgi:hypothetical protein
MKSRYGRAVRSTIADQAAQPSSAPTANASASTHMHAALQVSGLIHAVRMTIPLLLSSTAYRRR